MPRVRTDLPDALSRRGIRRVTEAIAPDQRVRVSGQLLGQFFAPELSEWLRRRQTAAGNRRRYLKDGP